MRSDRETPRFMYSLEDLKWFQVKLNLGILVDKDDLINYQLLIIYQLLIRTFTYQPTVDKTIMLSTNC